ncbi:MAG: beta-N-acetylhexosaminidase, partial [Lentisphaeria bacterium]|nr:beta-N-acetylhexosaminidase [Lentisphaeria bacterium]
ERVERRAETAPARHVTTVLSVAETRVPLLPYPKQAKFSGEAGFYPQSAPIAVVKGGDGEGRLLRHAQRALAPRGVTVRAGDTAPEKGIFIAVGEGIKESPEGYTLSVTPSRVTIRSATERGAFYGLQTLRALRKKDGSFRAAEIRDWPDFRFRGLHTKGNSGTLGLYSRILAQVAATLKLNAFMLECQYDRWDSLGGAKHPRGMSKAEFVELARIAHEHYIDFIPLQQTLSHNQWLFANGRNLDLAEDPESVATPYNYNPSDPRVYRLLEKIFDELVAASGTPYLHIGHDEIDDWGRARFPFRPENVKLGVRELFRRDVMWHHDYARRRNLKLMMWHDALLAKHEPDATVAGAIGGTETLRKELPRDIVICVWCYRDLKAFRDVDYFLREGYPVIGCTWEHKPGTDRGNIARFARYCLGKPGVLGMLETTWSHFGTETMLNSHFFQASACVTAAAHFWNGAAGLKNYSPETVFVSLMRYNTQPHEVRFSSIPFAGNVLLDDRSFGFDKLSRVMKSRGGIRFPIMKSGEHTAALTGRPGETLKIDLGGNRCDELYLLGTLLEEPVPRGIILARAAVEYSDGGRAEFYLRSPAATESFFGAPHFTDPDGKTSRELHEIFTPDAPSGYANRRDVCISWRGGFQKIYRLP